MFGFARLTNREQAVAASEKIQRDLMRRLSVTIRDRLERFSLFASRRRKIALIERRIADYRNVLRFAERQDMILDCTGAQVVDHLVAGNLFARQRLLRLFRSEERRVGKECRSGWSVDI